MANLNIATLPRITGPQLRSLLLSPTTSQSLAVIDVRDSDYIGGHIRNSQHVPSSSHDTALPELVRTLKDKKIVVFHCMLSQQRGPGAALNYARERQRLLKNTPGGGAVVVAGDGRQQQQEEEEEEGRQKVAVLERGFEGWVQSGYGEDERLTEAFAKDIWDEGFD